MDQGCTMMPRNMPRPKDASSTRFAYFEQRIVFKNVQGDVHNYRRVGMKGIKSKGLSGSLKGLTEKGSQALLTATIHLTPFPVIWHMPLSSVPTTKYGSVL